jgi:SAM-dependent methyltransferase
MRTPYRLCPQCGAADPICDNQAVWPAAWFCPACGRVCETSGGFPLFAPALADTLTGLNPDEFQHLARWEKGNYWFRPRNRLITRLLGRYFPAARDFMEIGCGTGFVLSAIAKMKRWRKLVGTELHPAGLSIARARLGASAEFAQMDARRILAKDAFDVIGAFDVLEHIEDDAAVLTSMNLAVRPGGGILLAVPQHPSLWSEIDARVLHVRRYARGELEKKAQAAGFRIIFSGSYNALLLPLMAISRWLGPGRNSDAMRCEFEPPRLVNNLLNVINQVEVTMTLAGMRFPIGGSRFIVALKPST